MFARRAATEVALDKQNLRFGDAFVVEGMHGFGCFSLFTIISRCVFTQSIKSDTFKKSFRDDAVGVDVMSTKDERLTGDFDSLGEEHVNLNLSDYGRMLDRIYCMHLSRSIVGASQASAPLVRSDEKDFACIRDFTPNSGCCDHDGRHEQGLTLGRPLPPFEISIRR